MSKTEKTPAVSKAALSLQYAKQTSLDPLMEASAYNPPEWRNLRNKSFKDTNMYDMLRDGVIKNGDFTGSDLSGTDFTYIDKDGNRKGFVLQGCIFTDCIFNETNFAYCDLRWSVFNVGATEGTCIFSDFDENGKPIVGSSANIREVRGVVQ